MGTWSEIFTERQAISPSDDLRKKYLEKLHRLTKRNVIAYYSGWLQNVRAIGAEINDADMNALMAVVNGLDRSKGLDLILHTPGGSIAAAESLVHYLKLIFGNDIRAIVPQLAMSAGTMMACSCKEIILGKHSNLGPIDPQFSGISCQAVIEEFQQAIKDVSLNPASLPIWQSVICKYHPTFIGDCQKAMDWSYNVVREWLRDNMFCNEKNAEKMSEDIVRALSDHATQKTHERHINADDCIKLGLKIIMMEENQKLQDAILSVHHAFIISLSENNAPIKIVENQNGMRMLFGSLNK